MGVWLGSGRMRSKLISMGQLLLTTLFLFSVLSSRKMIVRCAYQDKVTIPTESDPDVLHSKWRTIESGVSQLTESMVKQVLPSLVRMSSGVDVSTECTAAILKTVSALKEGKLWAFKMLDATGKPMGGQMMGTVSFLGSYHQCVNTTAMNPWEPNKEYFRGKYCLTRFRPPMPTKPEVFTYRNDLQGLHNLTLKTEIMQELKKTAPMFYSFGYQIGVCVPSVCTDDDMTQVVEYIAEKIGFNGELHSCETDQTIIKMDKDQIAVTIIIALLIAFVTIGTFLETVGKKFKKQFNYNKLHTYWKLVRAFSMRLNTKKIFDTSNVQESSTLSALNGMRFLSIGWVVVIHVYSLLNPYLYRESIHVETYALTFSFQLITSASLSVDTFFFITGVLVSHQIVSMVDKKGLKFFNVPIIIARRLWRLLPSAMMTLGLIVILPLMNSGPLWKEETGALLKATRENWWSVLACVSNFLPFHQMPMVSIWYISADVQLFLMALIILAVLYKHEAASYTLMVALAVGSIMASGFVVYCTKVLPIFLLNAPDKDVVFEQFFYGHTMTHNHISVYIIGMALGIYFARSSRPTIPLWSVLVGWPLALILLFTALFSAYAFTDGGIPGGIESFFFAAMYRTVWALGLAIMTFLCATKNGGFVNTILSWKAFIPLNRLSYLVYLLHVLFITYLHGSMRGVVDLSDHFNVWISVGTLGLSFVGAYFMKILFDGPMGELEKILLERIFKSHKWSKKESLPSSHHIVTVLPAVASIAVPQLNIATKF